MSLRGTRALFKGTMKYWHLFAFSMQSTTCLFHFKSMDIVTHFTQSVTGSSFQSTSRGEKLWEIFLKSITISLHLSAFSCIRWERDQSSTAVTACCTSPREPRGMVWEIVVSSTYFHMRASTLRSLIMSKKSQGPSLVPWGTPAGTGPHSEKQSEDNLMRWCRFVKKSVTQALMLCGISRPLILVTSILWLIRSKALQ